MPVPRGLLRLSSTFALASLALWLLQPASAQSPAPISLQAAHGFSLLLPAGSPDSAAPSRFAISNHITFSGSQEGQTGLSFTGLFWADGVAPDTAMSSAQEALAQAVPNQHYGLSLGISYQNVGRQFAGDASAAALKALTSQQGQTDTNVNLGFDDSHGTKAKFVLDQLANANTQSDSRSEALSLEHDFSSGLDLSISQALVCTTPALSALANTKATDDFHLAFAPARSGFSFGAEQVVTQTSGNGAGASQTNLNLAEKYQGLSFTGSLASLNTSGMAPDHSVNEALHLEDSMARRVCLVAGWDRTADLRNPGADKNDFNVALNAPLAKDVLASTQYTNKQDYASHVSDLQTTVALPRFIGLTKASWMADICDQVAQDRAATHKWDINFSGVVPGRQGSLLPTLPGASLQLEYAGNVIGAGTGADTPPAHQSYRALRIVSGPVPNNWLWWSIFQEPRTGSGTNLAAVRDYQIKTTFRHGGSLAYTNNDQVPQAGGSAKNTKTQDWLATWPLRPKSLIQATAEYVHGADRADNLALTQTESLGVAGPILGPKGSLSLSLGRTQQLAIDGGYAAGTTCKVACNWNADSSNMLNLASTVTVWDATGSQAATHPMQATAQIDFKKTYW